MGTLNLKQVVGLFFLLSVIVFSICSLGGVMVFSNSISSEPLYHEVSGSVTTSSSTITQATSYTKPIMKTSKLTFLFHGAPLGSTQYETLSDGKLIPVGGMATPQQHIFGDNNSNFSLVTYNPYQAYLDAINGINGPTVGRFSFKAVDINSAPYIDAKTLSCGDYYGEKSVLIKGLSTGWGSFIVSPGMTQLNFWKWFNIAKLL